MTEFGNELHRMLEERRISLREAARRAGCSAGYLSNVAHGRKALTPSVAARLDQVFGSGNKFVGYALNTKAAESGSDDYLASAEPAVNPKTSQPLILPVVLHGRSVLLPVDITAARAIGLDGLLAELTAEHHIVTSVPVYALPTRDLDELGHLASALDNARRYLDSSVVSYFRNLLERSKTEDGNRGPARALPSVLGILGAISQHVRDVKPGVRCQLLSLGADGAEFAGWLYRDLQDSVSATYWYDRAMEFAQEACDTTMQGYVLLRKSQMAYDLRDAHRVVTFAEAAYSGPWQFPLKIHAEVTQQTALGLAMTGEPIDKVERTMDDAMALLASAEHDQEHQQAVAHITANTLLLRQATCYTEAGKPAKAAALFADVIASGSLLRRDSGFFRARRAAALALSGEPDEAAAVGMQAVTIGRETHSERTLRLLADVVATLSPWRTRPGPRALVEELATSPRLSSP